MRRLKEIQKQKKKSKKRKANHEPKSTVRIYLGWRHTEGKGLPKQIVISRGGGTHTVDVEREAPFDAIEEEGKRLFFPEGINVIQGIRLEELSNISITKFDGSSPAKDRHLAVTVDEVVREVGSHPIRLYLTTQRGAPSISQGQSEEHSQTSHTSQTEYVSFT